MQQHAYGLEIRYTPNEKTWNEHCKGTQEKKYKKKWISIGNSHNGYKAAYQS